MAFYGAAPAAGTNFGTPAATGSTLASPTVQDIEVADPPADSISCLSWSPQADYLAAGSWDNQVRTHCSELFPGRARLTARARACQVRIYEVGAGGQTQGKAMFAHQAPVLSVCWNKARPFASRPRATAR